MPRIGRHFMPNMHRAAWGFMQSGDFPVPVLHLKFGEGSGNALKDSSPEGNDGTNHGATWVKGYLGPGLSFAGSDDSVSVAADPSLALTDEITVLMRVELSGANPAQHEPAFNLGGVAARCSFLAKRNAAGNYMSYWDQNNGWKDSTKSLTRGAWCTLGWKLKSADYIRFYVDGEFDLERAFGSAIPALDGSALVGFSGNPGECLKALADEVLVFDEGLSDAQMRQISRGYR